jgi:TolA-binding protein
MRRKQYRNARKALMSAVKVDRNNMDTLRYMRELNQVYKRSDQDRRSGFTQISDPNPIVIEENTSPDIREYNTGFLSFVNVLIGIVIGAAVIWLLIVPSITKRNAADYNQQVIEYSAQIAERNKEIDGLQNQISDLQTDLSRYQSEVGDAVNDAGASQQLLWQAMAAFLHDDTYEAGNAVAGIDPSALTDAQMKQVYEQLRERTGDAVTDALYSQALASYESGDFLASIEGFTKVLRMDDEYNSAIFYMGRAYHQLGDLVNAATYYKRLVQSA